MMCKKYKELPVMDCAITCIEQLRDVVLEEAPPYIKIGSTIIKTAFSIPDILFWNKFEKMIRGIKSNPDFAVKFAAKIANANTLESKESSKKIIAIINEIDDDNKIIFVINATRAYCWDLISQSQYYRICRAVTNTYYEDLLFVKNRFSELEHFAEDITVSELTQNGLMRLSIIDGGSLDPTYTPKTHSFTELAEMVYRYSLNYEKKEV